MEFCADCYFYDPNDGECSCTNALMRDEVIKRINSGDCGAHVDSRDVVETCVYWEPSAPLA